MPQVADRRTRAIAALAVLSVVWGYNWVVMKIAVHDAPPFQFAAWRSCGGAAALFLTALVLRKPLRPQYPRAFASIGLFQTTGFIGLVALAVVTAGAGQVAMLAYTMPFWVSLLAIPFLGERVGVWQTIASIIALVGVACMVGPLRSVGVAEWLAIAAGLSWAIGIVITKRLQRDTSVDTFGLTMWQMAFGGVVLLVVALVVPAHATTWDTSYILAIAYNIVFSGAIAYVLWTFALGVLPARDAGMGTLANPIVSVLAAWLQLGETPTRLSALGMLLIVSGLVVLTVADRRSTEA